MSKYKHVFGPEGFHMWQLTVLGHAVRSKESFETPELAACSCQFFKHYLSTEFRFEFPESLEGEMFATVAYRLNVNISDSSSVLSALPDTAKSFIEAHRAELETHRDAHPESIASKFRRSGMMADPRIREWVHQCESAEVLAKDYATTDQSSFFLRMTVAARSLSTAVKSLSLAVRLHGDDPAPALRPRVEELKTLIDHLQQTESYVVTLSARLRGEQHNAETALSKLESNRPPLT